MHPPGRYNPTWLEIVAFAKSNPSDFVLSTTPDGRRVCQFALNSVHVEISEDDWRLIVSGTLDRFRLVPPHPLEEDEIVELATVEILEQRLQTLITKADEVARKARQLNYHLSGRKAGINTRRSSPRHPQSPGIVGLSPPPRPSVLNPGYDLHADLLQQFVAPVGASAATSRPPSTNPILHPPPPPSAEPQRQRPTPGSTQHVLAPSFRPSPGQLVESPSQQREAAPGPPDDPSTAHRGLIQARIDRLSRGDAIVPPCDRCRRLKTTCFKHLTACQGCTRKHAKCSWKSVTEDEVAILRTELLSRAAAAPLGSGGDEPDASQAAAARPTASRESQSQSQLPETPRDNIGSRHPWPDESPGPGPAQAQGHGPGLGLGLLHRSETVRRPSLMADPEGFRWPALERDRARDEMDVDATLRLDKGKGIADERRGHSAWRDSQILSPITTVTSTATASLDARDTHTAASTPRRSSSGIDHGRRTP